MTSDPSLDLCRVQAERGRVPMLVPNPRPEDSHVRARVGDMDADQLSSDLSDYESYMSKYARISHIYTI